MADPTLLVVGEGVGGGGINAAAEAAAACLKDAQAAL